MAAKHLSCNGRTVHEEQQRVVRTISAQVEVKVLFKKTEEFSSD